MTRPAAVLFDLGNVLVGLDPSWHDHLGVSAEALHAWMETSEALRAYERGFLSDERFFAAMSQAFDVSPEQAAHAFTAWVTGPLPGAAQLLDELVVPAFALSNTNAAHWRMFDPAREIRSRLTPLASHHLGARKPEPTIYARAEAIVGSPDLLFVDDRLDNVEAARARGWRAEQVFGVAECRAVLRQHDLLG